MWEKGCFDLRLAYSLIRHVFSIYCVLSGEKTAHFCAAQAGGKVVKMSQELLRKGTDSCLKSSEEASWRRWY